MAYEEIQQLANNNFKEGKLDVQSYEKTMSRLQLALRCMIKKSSSWRKKYFRIKYIREEKKIGSKDIEKMLKKTEANLRRTILHQNSNLQNVNDAAKVLPKIIDADSNGKVHIFYTIIIIQIHLVYYYLSVYDNNL